MDPLVWLSAMTGVLGGMFYVARYFSDESKRRRAIRRARLWSIATLPEVELGRIVGTARAVGEPLTAPLSGRPCCYYFVRVYSSDEVFTEEARGIVFELDDGTGIATIDPDRAMSVLEPARYKTDAFHPATAAQVEFMRRHRYDGDYTSLRYEEAIVAPGDRIAVLGFGSRRDGKLHMSSSPRFPLVFAADAVSTHIDLPEVRAL